MSGVKHDTGKLRYDLLPPKALEDIVKVLGMGAVKYGDYNWAKGLDWTRLIAATQRHLEAFRQGIDKDDESQELHIAHAAVNLMFLLEHYHRNLGKDDRYKWSKE